MSEYIIETWEDEPLTGPYCEHCGWELDRELCEQCDGYGLSGHDCGEDCCCCLDPDEDNMPCDMCGGDGGWWICENDQCPGKAAP